MITKPIFSFSLLIFISFIFNQNICYAQNPPSITGYTCNPNQFNPCQTYVLYRARGPQFLDLASIGDLFSVSRLMIANPSNISNPNTTLVNDQPLFVPIKCSCNNINSTFGSISYAGLNYSFKAGDTMYDMSVTKYQNLTTYQSVEAVNPTVEATKIAIGQTIKFPIFCKCPTTRQNQPRLLITYVFQPNDNISSIASRFRITPQSITQMNGNNIKILDTIFIPLPNLPNLTRPASSNTPPPPPPPTAPAPVIQENDRKGTVIWLAIGLGVCGLLLILILGLFYKEKTVKREKYSDIERQKSLYVGSKKGSIVDKDVEVNLMADLSDCLDKYKMYKMEQLWEATNGFDEECLIQGSVYKGTIDGEVLAIKKMKWNAREEVSDKANSVEQSVRECNAEKEKVSVDVKERTNEKVRVKSAFGDNEEVEEVSTVCTVEEEEEIKVDGKTAGKKPRVWYRGKKHSGRKMVNRVGKVSDKADSAELSGQERNAEKEEISVDVKERANEKARVRGAFCANSDKSKDVLIDSEAGLNRTIEGDLGDLSLTDRRYGHGRSSVRVYGGKSYGSSRRYDVRKMLKQRDNSFAWIKKGESSNGNVAEIETQG